MESLQASHCGEARELAKRLGYEKLNSMQEKAVAEGLLSEKNVVVSAPTASGKTLIALLAVADNFLKKKGKAVYIVPLRALAQEKYEEFSFALSQFECRVALSTGEFDDESSQLAESDVVVATSEKIDSLLRHKTPWLKEVSLVVCDEVHLLNDDERGPALEMALTRLRGCGARFICLSATVPNAEEIAGWLDALLVKSDYRPTKLNRGIYCGGVLQFEGMQAIEVNEKRALEEMIGMALDASGGSWQVLVFVSTRRNAEATAKALIPFVSARLSSEEKGILAELARKSLKTFQQPTAQCEALAECLRNGVAFHHAGLENAKRRIIEEGFKKDKAIKVIVCTTTLAMGIDYPASWVFLRDVKRFDGSASELISNLECQQILGRAGRPRYDEEGFAVVMCAEKDLRGVSEKYFSGPLEKIYSKLSSEPALRAHSLALLSSNACNSFNELFEFFNESFFAFQYGGAQALHAKIEGVVSQLQEMSFVRFKNGKLLATPLGRRVSELYVEPLTAYSLLSLARRPEEKSVFDYLFALCSATEMRPRLGVKRSEENALWEEMQAVLSDFALDWENDYAALSKFKTAKALNAWINEESEASLMEEFELPPGMLHSLRSNAEWLAYALQELAFLENRSREYLQAKTLRKRIVKGVKEELLPLTKFRGIGRVRARKLWKAGVRSEEAFKALSREELKALVGLKESKNQVI
jgi:helicase